MPILIDADFIHFDMLFDDIVPLVADQQIISLMGIQAIDASVIMI